MHNYKQGGLWYFPELGGGDIKILCAKRAEICYPTQPRIFYSE